MSSSFRNRVRLTLAAACAVTAGSALPATQALGAQTYVQPQVDLRLEINENWDLDPDGGSDSDVYGYIADLQALIGIATPRSDTSLRPRIVLQEYPDRDDLSRFEGFLDLRSTYQWEASDLFLIAKYARQDLYNSQLPKQVFDPLDPNYGNDADSGRINVGVVRNRFSLSPTYTHRVSDRLRIGARAYVDSSRYDSDDWQDYNYWQVAGLASWSLSPRTEIGGDFYSSVYETTDDTVQTDGLGVGVNFVHRYSDTAGFEGRVFYEDNDTETFVPVRTEDSTSGWGGNLTAYVNGEVTQWRFTAEQAYWPSGAGGKKETNQLRAQYLRDLTQRLKFNGAARYFRERALGNADNKDDRDFARFEVSLRYSLSSTWYVLGGYAYVWQEFVSDTGDANNNQLFLSVGYRGLDRPRR